MTNNELQKALDRFDAIAKEIELMSPRDAAYVSMLEVAHDRSLFLIRQLVLHREEKHDTPFMDRLTGNP